MTAGRPLKTCDVDARLISASMPCDHKIRDKRVSSAFSMRQRLVSQSLLAIGLHAQGCIRRHGALRAQPILVQ
jgi:hypothetical protein